MFLKYSKTPFIYSYAGNCDVWDGHDWECCSANRKCGLGEGDCDSDDQCKGDLVCGTDNCSAFISGADQEADCCVKPGSIFFYFLFEFSFFINSFFYVCL